jgi:hypothetical protein
MMSPRSVWCGWWAPLLAALTACGSLLGACTVGGREGPTTTARTTGPTTAPAAGASGPTVAPDACSPRPVRLAALGLMPVGSMLAAVEDPAARCALLFAGRAEGQEGVTVRRVSHDRRVEAVGVVAGAERILAMAADGVTLWAGGVERPPPDRPAAALLVDSNDRGATWHRRPLPSGYEAVDGLAVTQAGELLATLQRGGRSDLVVVPRAPGRPRILGRAPVVMAWLQARGGALLAAGGAERGSVALVGQGTGRPALVRLPKAMSEVRAVVVEGDGSLAIGGVTRRPDLTTVPLLLESIDRGRTWHASRLPAGSELLDLVHGDGGSLRVLMFTAQGYTVYVRASRGGGWTILPTGDGQAEPSVSRLLQGRSAFWAWGDQVYVGLDASAP